MIMELLELKLDGALRDHRASRTLCRAVTTSQHRDHDVVTHYDILLYTSKFQLYYPKPPCLQRNQYQA